MGGPHPLLTWLAESVPEDPFQRVLVVAGSAGAAAALRRGLTDRRGALLGVDFVTAAGLGRALLAVAGEPAAETVPDPLEEREALRRRLPGHGIGRYAQRFAGALLRLLDTVHEVATLGPLPAPQPLAAEAREVVDLATALREEFAGSGGASRWIAAATHRLAAGPAVLPDRVLVVPDPGAPRNLLVLVELLRNLGADVHEAPIAELRAEVVRWSCPDPFAELRRAARGCADAGAAGIRWHEMVVAAPHLGAYTDGLARAFSSEGVPFETTAGTPLVHEPRAAVALHAARLLFGTAPRESFVALVRSPLLRRPIGPSEQARFDRRSRLESLQGTGEPTRAFLADLGPKQRPVCRLLDAVVRTAARAARMKRNAQRSHCLESFLARHLVPPDAVAEPAAERLADCLRAVVFADPVCADGAGFLAEFEDLLRRRTVPLAGQTRGGVHVVPTHDALGYPAAHLHLLGLTSAFVPGPPPRTTFLDDAARSALQMPTAETARSVEAIRYRRLLSHAPRVVLSHPRTDIDGREQEPTRFLERGAGLSGLPEETRDPGHPAARAERAVASGRCPPDLAVLHLAFGRHDAIDAFRAIRADTDTDLLAVVAGLESFDPRQLARDGDVGHGSLPPDEPIAVTDLGRLGRCPQQFFFRRALGLRALPEEPDPLSLPRDRMGSLIHGVIEALYREFRAPLCEAADPTALHGAMAARVALLLDAALATDTSLLPREFPGLHRLLRQRWLDGLVEAVGSDLAILRDDGSRPRTVEDEIRRALAFRGPGDATPAALVLLGKIDRIDLLADGSLRVLDHKTGLRPESATSALRILRGRELQLAAYALLAEAEHGAPAAALEVRSVRPAGGRRPEYRHAVESADALLHGSLAQGLHETLAVLARLLDRGLFLPKPDRHCAWCDFRSACRRFHPPSAERVAACAAPEQAEYLALQHKSIRQPTLLAQQDGP